MVALIDLVDGKVGTVDGGLEVGLKRGIDSAERVPDNPFEERMSFDLRGAVLTGCVAETIGMVAEESNRED